MIPSLRRLSRLRDPRITSPATRHAAQIAEALIRGEPYPMLDTDREHCGEAIAATVETAWSARAQLRRLGWAWRADAAGRMRWVRDDR